jgi:hypothetical protein
LRNLNFRIKISSLLQTKIPGVHVPVPLRNSLHSSYHFLLDSFELQWESLQTGRSYRVSSSHKSNKKTVACNAVEFVQSLVILSLGKSFTTKNAPRH